MDGQDGSDAEVDYLMLTWQPGVTMLNYHDNISIRKVAESMSHILKSTDRTISDVKIADNLVLFIETDGSITVAAKIKTKQPSQLTAPKPQPPVVKGKPGRKPKVQVATAPVVVGAVSEVTADQPNSGQRSAVA